MFTSSKDIEEERDLYLNNENVTIMVISVTNELIKVIYISLLTKYYVNKTTHETTINCGGSYLDSLIWLKNTINTRNDDCKCFQFVVTVGLNKEKIPNIPGRVTNIEPLTKCN